MTSRKTERLPLNDQHYSCVLEWSDEDKAYIAYVPEFGRGMADGGTWEQAVRELGVALRLTIQTYHHAKLELPKPRRYVHRLSGRKPRR